MADESKRVAECSKKEAALNNDLNAALTREAAAAERDRKRREAAEKQNRQREADALKRRYEQQLRAERNKTAAMISASEGRMSAEISRLRPPQVEPLRILYLTAASRGDLRVDEEIRRVKAGVQAATHRDLVQIEHLPAATPSDLLDGLSRFRPHVVHFSGHSNETVLVFDTGSDAPNPGQHITAQAFARAMSAVDLPPTLVVLNSCKSEAQLAGLLDAVPIAIGMSSSVKDGDAMTFATRFYTAVADGQSVNSAYLMAKVQMEFNGLTGADLPALTNADGIDPAEVKLVIPPAGGTPSVDQLA
ncbi:CHAT domain-containing protein [Dactylosporangium sp. NPDC049742]|uniref:CHAT domain-containing protein n=1 Tax=Dactylosporangium sp. NPDC049742 TaxID=3154737 RepID=UPI00343C6A32